MKKKKRQLLSSLIALVLILWCVSCSGNDTPCDALCEAEKLDRNLAGEGKICLEEREGDIDRLILAYMDASEETAGTPSHEVAMRIADLEFELELVVAIKTAFETIQAEVAADIGFRPDVQGMQAELKKVYVEASFYEPIEGLYHEIYEGPSVAPEEPTGDYSTWFMMAYSTLPEELPEWFIRDVIAADDLTGYDLTHQFMCYRIQEIAWPDYDFSRQRQEKRDELAHRIAAEQMAVFVEEEYSIDLYAERLYVLIDSGYYSVVERQWFERLLDDRLTNGVWPRVSGDESPRWHATHLALMALAEYQVILQRGEEGREEMFLVTKD